MTEIKRVIPAITRLYSEPAQIFVFKDDIEVVLHTHFSLNMELGDMFIFKNHVNTIHDVK